MNEKQIKTTTFAHQDSLQELNEKRNIADQLHYVHNTLRGHIPSINRVAVALYDPNTDYVRTFVYSSDETSPLNNYQAKLQDCYSLSAIAKKRCPRVVNDLSHYASSEHKHTKLIAECGYLSSYTVPMIWEGSLLGFIFFNASETNVFEEYFLHELDTFSHLLTLLVYNEVSNLKTLTATIRSALTFSHSKDPETGFHLERMSHYSRLIAKELSVSHNLDDQLIEYIFLFAPLHDIGKITIPDNILLKEGRLSDEEFEQMKTHSEKGKELIDTLLENYGLETITHVDMLRNIALSHHEAFDGSGYPQGLSGENIPLEARIVSVGDIFDALTSRRSYKEAWSNDKAYSYLQSLSGTKLDPDCVDALLRNRTEINDIQRIFQEDPFG